MSKDGVEALFKLRPEDTLAIQRRIVSLSHADAVKCLEWLKTCPAPLQDIIPAYNPILIGITYQEAVLRPSATLFVLLGDYLDADINKNPYNLDILQKQVQTFWDMVASLSKEEMEKYKKTVDATLKSTDIHW